MVRTRKMTAAEEAQVAAGRRQYAASATVITALAPQVVPSLVAADGAMSLRDRVRHSEARRQESYARTGDDATALSLLVGALRQRALAQPTPFNIFATSWAQTPEGAMSTLWHARWADQGFPVVRVGEKLGASFMATGFQAEAASSIQAPWKAFVVVPPPLLAFPGVNGMEAVTEILVLTTTAVQFPERPDSRCAWFVGAVGDKGTMLHRLRAATDLFTVSDGPAPGVRHALTQDMTDTDERVTEMVMRLVGGVCLEMSDPNTLEGSKRGKAHARQSRASEPPEPRVYELARAVKLDVRSEIRAYVQGRRSTSPSVQVLVAGHWKRQRCGPGGLERKVIQIEPYWRGPDLSPVLAKTE